MWEAPAKALPFHQQGMAKDSQGLIDPELPFPLGSHIISAPCGTEIIGYPFAVLEVAPNAQRMAHKLPVDKVLRVENGQPGNTVERTRREVIIVAHGHHIRVAIVGVEHRVGIGAIPIVGAPRLRKLLGARRMPQQEAQ